MDFKSRIARGLPLLALVAALVVPFKPVAAAAKEPYPVKPVAPAAQLNAGNLAAGSQEEDARLYRPRKPRHGKELLAAPAEDEVLAAGKTRDGKHDRKGLVASDELDETGKLRSPGHGKKRLLTAASDELDATRRLKRKRA